MSFWADVARDGIAKVLAENPGADEATLRRKLFEAYPFGQRKHWPYKVWCAEVRRALKLKQAPEPTPMDILIKKGDST